MERKENYTLLPVQDDHNCFACGPANPSGLHMRFYADEDSVVSWLTVPEHLRGWSTLVHGGIISTILTVEFIKPIHIGQQLKAEGKILKIVNRKEVLMEGRLSSHDGNLCASARGSFALLKPNVAERLGIVDAKDLKYLNTGGR